MAEQVFRLIYTSHNVVPPDSRQREMGHLFSTARSNNKKQQITGALLLTGDAFAQTLEGDEQAVRSLFDHIRDDPRHTDVALVESGMVDDRVFGRWSMARASEDSDETEANLIAHADGIHAASSRGDETEEQEALLRVMRDAARGQTPVP